MSEAIDEIPKSQTEQYLSIWKQGHADSYPVMCLERVYATAQCGAIRLAYQGNNNEGSVSMKPNEHAELKSVGHGERGGRAGRAGRGAVVRRRR
jgi:hypothetical protein